MFLTDTGWRSGKASIAKIDGMVLDREKSRLGARTKILVES
jgi:hypothetical protein